MKIYFLALFPFILIVLSGCEKKEQLQRNHYQYSGTGINRFDLVNRNNITITEPDTLGSLSVGNGEFAFTVDASGLQSFYQDYENGIALGTMAQWAWHATPSSTNYTLNDVAELYTTESGKRVPYPVQHKSGEKELSTNWLRSNPHRLHLGIIGLQIFKKNGDLVELKDIINLNQTLNLWTGKVESNYEIEGIPVKVELYAQQNADGISARITSSLADDNRLKVFIKFPYGKECHTCAGYDFYHPKKHTTTLLNPSSEQVILERKLDSTLYYVNIQPENANVEPTEDTHTYYIVPDNDSFTFSIQFQKTNQPTNQKFATTEESNSWTWEDFWTSGGAIDFSDCTDSLAKELERRVVLSQYLTKIQCAGSMPPQETGLTMNSWYGKFHLEMHWWHGVHFALWNRINLLEKSMMWYSSISSQANNTAIGQGYQGVRWPKMTNPSGEESPSDIGAFIIWQQPHPIYLAELFYRQNPRYFLPIYKQMVFETADFMASFAQYNNIDKKYHLSYPVIPAQEVFNATTTKDPIFETRYWTYGLSLAQEWRKRAELPPKKDWQTILDNFASLPQTPQQYLPVQNITSYSDDQLRRDHPMVAGTFGLLPWDKKIDSLKAVRTFQDVMERWNWESTWGWDYPMLAMTAARLGNPEMAISLLLKDVPKNTYLVNGHNYQDKRLRLYLPGNGGLLTAVAMMAAGWDKSTGVNPGFPKDGKWNVKWENLQRMP